MRNFFAWAGGLLLAVLSAVVVLWRNGRTRHVAMPGDAPTLGAIMDKPTPGKTLAAAHRRAQEEMHDEASNHDNLGDAFNAMVDRGKRRD